MKSGNRLPATPGKGGNPFGNGLMGRLFERQKNLYVSPPENVPLVPLQELAAYLISISDEQWGRYAFSRDPIDRRFTREERSELTRQALDCGEHYAAEALAHGYAAPEALAEHLGVRVRYPFRPSGALEGSRVLFAQYITPNKIDIYTDCTQRADEAFAAPELRALLGEVRTADVLLCHELFHYFEHRDRKTVFTETARKDIPIFGCIPNRARILCLGEIAAMRFAQRLLDLPYSPYVYDVLLTYLYNEQAACNLCAEIRSLAPEDAS